MDFKQSPTLYPQHAHLLCIGESLAPGAAKSDDAKDASPGRVDELGTWELHEAALEALERAIKLAREVDSRRIILDMGDCLCLDERDWRGVAVDRLARFSPRQPSRSIVMTPSFQNAIRPHIEDPNDLAPLLSPTTAEEQAGLSLFQTTSPTPTYVRSNLVLGQGAWVGRERDLDELTREIEEQRSVLLRGGAGTGKSALARAYAARVAAHEPGRELWWISIEECATSQDLAMKFAQLFQIRLGASEEHWSTRISAMLSNRPLPPTLVLDGADALQEDARPWLARLIQSTHEVRWLITSRRELSLEGTPERELTGLSEVDALVLLMASGGASAPVEDLDSARQIWRACSGHPAALLHARRHIHAIGEESESLDKAFSQPLRLERDWQLFGEDEQTVLLVLGKMLTSTSANMLERIIGNKVDLALGRLERIGWVQRDPSTTRVRWTVPGLFKEFTEEHVDKAQVEAAVAMRADALLEHLGEALDDLRTRRQPEALGTLVHHEVDMLDMLDWGLEHRTEQTLGLVAKMRMFYTIAHNSFFYLPLLERAKKIAESRGDDRFLRELALSQAIFADYNPDLTKDADELYSALLEEADAFEPRSRAELHYFYATYLEDMTKSPEDLERCISLLETSRDILETEAEDLCRRAGCYCALARIELQRGNVDAALDYSLRGREYAIATGSHVFLGMTSFSLHRAYLLKGERAQARRHGQLALEEMEKAGAAPGAIMALASIGYMQLFEGQAESSRQYFYRALQLSQANSYFFGEMNCNYLLGVANLLDMRWEHARDHLLEAEKFQIEFELDWNLNQNRIVLAIALSGLGEVTQARNLLQEANEYFDDCPNPEVTDMMAMADHAPAVYEAGWIEHDLEKLEKIEEAIRAHEFDNEMESGPGQAILLSFIEAARQELGEAATREVSPLRVAVDGTGFQLPDTTDEIDLSRRRTVKRVLAILVKTRVENPGEVLDAHTLVERGWPGEVFEVRAGLMRLYVTINTLRKLGLEDILQTHGEGYRLDPDVPVEVYGHADDAAEG